jgi:hypothetical protein
MTPDKDSAEPLYRRGYADGARDVITAVRSQLAASEHAKLEVWFGGLAREWRTDEAARRHLTSIRLRKT